MWEANIKIDPRELGWFSVDWINLAQDTPVEGSFEHDNERSDPITRWEILE
jgi:hypothetical protein